ncbi:type II secretion system F family protein [Celerinatantimonas yamalensis]|uniref:Type II secretion system F family protein n=1 Tax=Celerinatantimonas yamalensis TaxID=559956 RepID=A0ABW9G592_9GAMM
MSSQRLNSYRWNGINTHGKRCHGIRFADSTIALQQQLNDEQISLISEQSLPHLADIWIKRSLSPRQRQQLMQQLASALGSGLSLKQTLANMRCDLDDPRLSATLGFLHASLNEGISFYRALTHCGQFPALERQLIYTAEQSGQLAQTCHYISDYLERQIQLRQQAIRALSYPALVFTMAISMLFFLLHVIVPQFSALFTRLHTPLPMYTQWVMHLAQLTRHSLPLIGVILMMLALLGYAYHHYPSYRLAFDRLQLRIPWLGQWLEQLQRVRVETLLTTTYQSGLTLKQGLECTVTACSNLAFEKRLRNAMSDLEQGQSFYLATKKQKIFAANSLQLLRIGEESGTLATMLKKVSEIDSKQLTLITQVSLDLIEPLVMAIVGLLVGGIVVAMYLPVFQIGNVIH